MTLVAAIQFAPAFKRHETNLRKLSTLVEEAAKKGAKLIVAPELATTGYSFMSDEEARPFAEPVGDLEMIEHPSSSRAAMWGIAKKYGCCIAWGLVEIDSNTQKLYNSQAYIEPSGYCEIYRKINPFGNDYLWASEGMSNPPVVDSPVLKKRVGLLICRDVRDKKNDDWNNFYSKGDADIVAFSANWGDGGFPATTWVDFAKDNGVTLVVSNRYGQETCNNFGEGGICIIEKTGKVHCKGLLWSEDCIVMADVP